MRKGNEILQMSIKNTKWETVPGLPEVVPSIWELLHVSHLASSKDSRGANKDISTNGGRQHGQVLMQPSSYTAIPNRLHSGDVPPAGKRFPQQDSSNYLTAVAPTGRSTQGSHGPLSRLDCTVALRRSITETHRE